MAEVLTPKQKSAIQRAQQNPDLQGILFQKAIGLNWFPAFIEAGFLSPSDIPPPVSAKEEGYVNIPAWPITDYLVATSEELRDPQNFGFAAQFLEFIRATTTYAREQGFGNYRVWWQFSKIIRNIPPHLFSLDDFALIDYWLNDKYERGLIAESLGEHWLISLLDQNDEHCRAISIKLLEVLFRTNFVNVKYGDADRKKAVLRANDWHSKKLTKIVAARVGRILGLEAVEIFHNQLEKILVELNKDKWSSIWRPAIEDHEQNNGPDDAEDIILEGYRDALIAYIEDMPIVANEYVGQVLDSQFETIRRIAIYAIDQQFKILNTYVDNVICNGYFTCNFRHELWHLLKNYYKEFTPDQKQRVLEIIYSLVEMDENDQVNQGHSAYTRAIWLSAIKDYGEDVAQLYHQCVEVAGAEPNHPDFSSYMSSGLVDHKSPIPVEELLSLEVDELVKQLSLFEDRGSFAEPSFNGLVKAFRQAVKAEPLRFSNQLQMFAESDLPFIYSLIEVYQELWAEKAQLPWDNIWGLLLKFCQDIVKEDRFWSSDNTKERSSFVANRYWVVGAIGRLIEAGTKSDEHAFNEKFLKNAENVLIRLLEMESGAEFKFDSNAVIVAINSPRGRCLEGLINLTLRSCRLEDKQYGNHSDTWAHFQPIFNSELRRADIGEYEFATLVSNYLPNFLYMSKEWVFENLETIFDQNNYQRWLCAMQGYAYVGSVYEGIYNHLKEQGHLIKALDDENIKERVDEKVIQNISVAYINDFEKLGDASSLITQLLQRKKQSELSYLIWFLWTLRKDDDKNIKAKVLDLWPLILDHIDTSSREGRLLASKLCDWASFVDEVNEQNRHLILAVAPFSEENYNSYDLLKSIAKISERQPTEAYEIWLRLLEGAKPDFPEEAIREALTNFMRIGQDGKRMAKNIVSEYLKGGNERPSQWMREIMI